MIDSNYFPGLNRQLIITQHFLILNCQKSPYSLQISLQSQLNLIQKVPKTVSEKPKLTKSIQAVYGIIDMEINQYLILVTQSAVVGQIYKKIVFQVEELDFICLIDETYVKGLKKVLDNKSLYFSLQYDLTQTLQNYAQNNTKISPRQEYMYNGEWVKGLLTIQAYQWVTPFISGLVTISFVHLNSTISLELSLISRRSKYRQGLRYLTRGANKQGYNANTCQTQIILYVEKERKQSYWSFVQLRGSFPYLWKQDPDLNYKPEVKITRDLKLNKQIAQKHYKRIQRQYGKCTCVNLVNSTGFQKQLGTYFQLVHKSLQMEGFQFVWFDFHKQCNTKFQSLIKLVDKLSSNLQDYSYYHIITHQNQRIHQEYVSKVQSKQVGIFRTNCLDCLDRTNVVQSVLARRVLIKWLAQIGVFQQSQYSSPFQKLPPSLESVFKEQWIENASALSFLYASTQAMKTDITSKGKITIKSKLNDLRIGVKRFFLGHFYDSRKEDFIHFSLGSIKPVFNQGHRVRHSCINSLYFVGALVVLIPFLVVGAVNQYNQDQQSPRVVLKVSLTMISYTMFIKACRLLKSLILRKPIGISE